MFLRRLAKLPRLFLAIAGLVALTLAVLPPPRASAAPTAYSVRSDLDDQLYQIDLATGVATAIGPVGFADVEGLSFNCAGILFGVDDITDQLVTINLVTGAGTAVGPLGISVNPLIENDFGLTFDAGGNLWLSTDSPQNFYSINPATGAATLVGPQGQPVTGLAGSAGGVVYGLGGDLTNNLVTLNTATGAATIVGPLGGAVSPLLDGGIDFDAGGILWGLGDPTPGIGNPGEIFTINAATGAATLVATPTIGGLAAGGFEGLAIANPATCAPTPTPTSTATSTATPTATPTAAGPTSTPLPPPPPTNPPPPPPTDVPPPPLNDPLIAKNADVQTAQVGDPVQFTITVFNPNSVPLTNVVVVDTLPPQLDFVSGSVTQGSFTFDAGSNTVTFNVNDLGAGQSAALTMQTVVNDKAQPGDVLHNLAVVSVNGQQKGQAEASVQIIPPIIPVTGSGPGWREQMLILVLAVLAALAPYVVWLWRRQVRF